jgi:pyrroline-5-carboxylate reductase
MTFHKIAFLGAGRMASAMVSGILKTELCQAREIICTGANDGTAELLAANTGIGFTFELSELTRTAPWLILACKPQQLATLPPVMEELTSGKNVLSILAGTPIAKLSAQFPRAATIVRCMPNTPGQIGAGITAFSSSAPLGTAERNFIEKVLASLGKVLELPEEQLDAVTALSGSGPAYVFSFIAALRDGGIQLGLAPEVAYDLALETVKGSAQLLEAIPESPETHREWVSSPGGTTLAGLAVLQEAGFAQLVGKTLAAARQRAEELAR